MQGCSRCACTEHGKRPQAREDPRGRGVLRVACLWVGRLDGNGQADARVQARDEEDAPGDEEEGPLWRVQPACISQWNRQCEQGRRLRPRD